nr:FAD-dependent oxidoreductase [uncultured Shuttleworthia sp.]
MGKENWYSMEFRQAKVTKIVKETSDIYSIQMEIPEGYTWRAGQYAIWQLQDYVAPEGEKEDRVFTIASAMEDHFLMFSTRIADQHSWFKDILLRQLEAGDTMLVSAPLGEMDIDMEGKERSLLIAGGIGVTPIRSLLRHYSSNNVPTHKIQLLYADNRGEFAYGDFWKQIEGKMPNVKLQLLTDSNVFAEKARNYAVSHGNEAEYLIAGSPGMNQAFKESLTEAGVSGGNMKTDEFFGYE